MKVFVVDVARCNGCYCCQVACKDEHVDNDWTPYAKPQPDTGQYWVRLHERIRGTVPKVKMHYVPILCMHCDNAACIASCPVEGAIYKRDDGLVLVDPEKCNGCKNCVDACAYGAIYFNEELSVAQKCTGCAHLLDGGHEIDVPRCVDACPTDALRIYEEADALSLLEKAEVLDPGSLAGVKSSDDRPRVYYLNVPKQFVAGTVYDPIQREIVADAVCTLRSGGAERTTTTNRFGDFWFEGLEADTYSLTIEANGFLARTIDSISAKESVNLGDIPLAS